MVTVVKKKKKKKKKLNQFMKNVVMEYDTILKYFYKMSL